MTTTSPPHPQLTPGTPFPDLTLTDHAGNRRALSELVADDPAIVHCYRGWWCPKEQTFFRRLLALQEEAEVAYCRIISISVDPQPVVAAYRAGLGARWTFLCDPDREALELLGLRETTDTVNHPYVPAVFSTFPTSRSTPPTTATGTGAGRRTRSCAPTCGRSAARCGRLDAPTP
jgi:peroxiredoxin